MKPVKRKVQLWLALAAFLVLMATGCGPSDPVTTPSPPEEEAVETPVGEAVEPAGPVNLSVWSVLTVQAQAEVIQRHVNECLSKMPNVTAEFEAVSNQALYPRLITSVEQGDPPNVMNLTENAVAFLQARDGIVPVDDIIDELGRDDFTGSYLDLVTKDGATWAVPDWALHQEVWYREDLFAEKGLEVPNSWQELLEVATALTEDTNGDGEIDIYGFAVPMGRVQVAAQTYFQILYSAGAYIYDPETGQYIFGEGENRQKAIEAMQFMVDLYHAASPPASIDWAHGDFRTAYVNGQVAMTNEWGAVVLQGLEQNPDIVDSMSVFPFPGPDAATAPAAVLAGGYYYLVGNSTPAEVEASKELIKCMFEVTRVAERANSRPVFAIPATQSAFDSDIYKNNEVVQAFRPELEIIFTDVMDTWYRYGMEAGLNPISGQIEATTFVGDAIQNVALGRATAEEAVDSIDQQLRYQLALLGMSTTSQ